jgi:hypothetical protein
MSYKIEFGTLFDLGINIAAYPNLVDKSFKNDTSPSFWFKTSQGYSTLWIDYPNSSDREDDNLRYTVISSENFGDDENPEIFSSNGDVVFQCELGSDLINYLDSLTFT